MSRVCTRNTARPSDFYIHSVGRPFFVPFSLRKYAVADRLKLFCCFVGVNKVGNADQAVCLCASIVRACAYSLISVFKQRRHVMPFERCYGGVTSQIFATPLYPTCGAKAHSMLMSAHTYNLPHTMSRFPPDIFIWRIVAGDLPRTNSSSLPVGCIHKILVEHTKVPVRSTSAENASNIHFPQGGSRSDRCWPPHIP